MGWRFWLLGALTGALLGAAFYLVFPPEYRARATVVVDQNVEQVIPEEQQDLRKYIYLQRETDKLIEVAWADATLSIVAGETGLTVSDLRDGRLVLSQPSDGGWRFYGVASDPATAESLASAWAAAFSDQVQAGAVGVSPLAEIETTQLEDLPVSRSVSLGVCVFWGSLAGVFLFAFGVLFFHRKEEQ